jgi:hypothetical protein
MIEPTQHEPTGLAFRVDPQFELGLKDSAPFGPIELVVCPGDRHQWGHHEGRRVGCSQTDVQKGVDQGVIPGAERGGQRFELRLAAACRLQGFAFQRFLASKEGVFEGVFSLRQRVLVGHRGSPLIQRFLGRVATGSRGYPVRLHDACR